MTGAAGISGCKGAGTLCAGICTASAHVFCWQNSLHRSQKFIKHCRDVDIDVLGEWRGHDRAWRPASSALALERGARQRKRHARRVCNKSHQSSMLFSRTINLEGGEQLGCGRIIDTRAMLEGIW